MNSAIPVVMGIRPQGSRSMFASYEHNVLREEIGRQILYPDLTTDRAGSVSVNESTASHSGLLEYVTNCLSRMIFGAEEAKERNFRLTLKFMMY